MEKCLIVAVADNWAIGRGNDIPWHISEDLKFFKRTTVGSPVIMGRKTYESIGRPLPKRLNIVVSRNFEVPEGSDPNALVAARTLADAFSLAEKSSPETGKCFVMGGGQLYAAAVDKMDVLYVTHVHTVIEDAEVYFPAIDPAVWERAQVSETAVDPETGYSYEFVTYRRK